MSEHSSKKNFAVVGVEGLIFSIKWVLPLFYCGLAVVLGCYAYSFAKEIYEVIMHVSAKTTDDMKLICLDFIDIIMIANLIVMIIVGSYNSFVSKDHGRKDVNHSSGILKLKIGTSIIIVGSIHLLRLMVSHEPVPADELHKVVVIYALFLASAVVLGGVEFLHHLSEKGEKKHD